MLKQSDLSRTDLTLLTLFEAVLEERHVGRAAERLNLSPLAVSLGRLRRPRHCNEGRHDGCRCGVTVRHVAQPTAGDGRYAQQLVIGIRRGF